LLYPALQPLAGRYVLTHPGIKVKVESKKQYDEYLEDLKSIREELGVNLSEDLYPDTRFF
jgi:hydrogenase maturation factor